MGFFQRFKEALSVEAKKEHLDGIFAKKSSGLFRVAQGVCTAITFSFAAIGFTSAASLIISLGLPVAIAAITWFASKPLLRACDVAMSKAVEKMPEDSDEYFWRGYAFPLSKMAVNTFLAPAKVCVRAFRNATSRQESGAGSLSPPAPARIKLK